ncbi:alpha-galactosidase [Bacteroides sp. L10-4]|uniref:alpha-galactosidase D n=1 Tax=Bacteroides sp. L10-4 TaxID=2746063 RepID=UPI0015959F92|nr:alpha-galactosidase [Bacteroides sp. L10-4]NVK95072.1 alpha-galactosidase [Bacteroides sp. L10-4]
MKFALLFLLLGYFPAFSLAQPTGGEVIRPLMGWSSWNTYRVNISDELIKKQADALVQTGLKEAGYTYINIDDGFFGHRDSTGQMVTHPVRFPHGLKGVAEHIHSLGLKAGIYSDAGSNTCGSIWDNDTHGVGSGLYGHELQDARLYFNDWGFDFIKIDYCGAGQELDLEEERRYSGICRAIREVAERPVSVNICRWAFPGTWAARLACSWRISPDIRPEWASVKSIIRKNLYLSAYAGGGHYNDMDMLEIGRGLTPVEEETHFGMWCIMSSPLLIGCDLTTISEASLRLLKNKELIALNQDWLGLQAYVALRQGEGYVLVKDVEQLRGRIRAVALYNPSDTVCGFHVPLEALELAGTVKVRDVVRQRQLPSIQGVLCKEVPPHGVLMLRLEGERRIEPSLYEAEWAYLPCFNDLGKSSKTVAYVPMPEASGGMKIAYVGGSCENYAEWNKVYSERGGWYELTVDYIPGKYRRLLIEVNNGEPIRIDRLRETAEGRSVASITVPVRLKAGYNTVRMGSPYCWAPDIDCFQLKRIGD